MDPIQEAFSKVKKDIEFLYQEINELKTTLKDIESYIKSPTPNSNTPTLQHQTPTLQHRIEPPNGKILDSSTGNGGVPTLQQTNQQTNQPTLQPTLQHPLISDGKDKLNELQRVSEIIGSLDTMKKEIRVKIKKLTGKEMAVYSLIYQFEDQGLEVDYSLISEQLQLSEISIRDYVRKISNKGIPLNKIKTENNKVMLSIPGDFKKLASLQTLLSLREL